jgi:hypothetical protein
MEESEIKTGALRTNLKTPSYLRQIQQRVNSIATRSVVTITALVFYRGHRVLLRRKLGRDHSDKFIFQGGLCRYECGRFNLLLATIKTSVVVCRL